MTELSWTASVIFLSRRRQAALSMPSIRLLGPPVVGKQNTTMQGCGNGNGSAQGIGISEIVKLEAPQLPNALAPLV